MGGCDGPIFISRAEDSAAASAWRFLRLRRHTRVTAPMMTRMMMGTAAAAAYMGVLLESFLDQSHPEGRPPSGPTADGEDTPVRVLGSSPVTDNGNVVPASGYGVAAMPAGVETDVSQLFVAVGVPAG
jgi:hypothetical protein